MYKILSTKVNGETLTTEVEYTFKDGEKLTISVPSFQPDTKADVLAGVENREISEQRKIDAEKKNITIKSEIDADIAKDG